jgi:competence protein CoiA
LSGFGEDHAIELAARSFFMLTAIRWEDQRKLAAREADKGDGPFFCQCCNRQVSLRKGGVRSSHFAHLPPVTCEYGTGESEEHRQCKLEIYNSLVNHPNVRACEIERNLGTVRPDISAYINGVPVAIEVQLSTLPLEKIQKRTIEYESKGIYLLWLPKYGSLLEHRPYSPRPWERWLHTLYFGKIYYWLKELEIVPVRFSNYIIEASGRTKSYRKISKRYKLPIKSESLILTTQFTAMNRTGSPIGSYTIPASKLWVDAKTNWD